MTYAARARAREAPSAGRPRIRWWREPGFLAAMAVATPVHVALSIWSMWIPERATLGDRAAARIDAIHALLDSTEPLRLVLERGGPGDYAVHALFVAAGGLPSLLAVQLLAFLATLALLYHAARDIGAASWAAAAATAAYALLPSNLHQPHTVVTEAFFSPAVAGIVVLVLRALRERRLSSGGASAMGGLAALCVALRPMFLPALPVLCVWLAATGSARAARLVLANAIALAPVLVLAALQLGYGEPVALGGRGFTLEANLRGRMQRMAAVGGAPVPATSGVGDYVRYSASNPGAFARTTATDAVMLVVNPGVNHTFGRFLGLFEMPEGTFYWAPLVDRKGFVGATAELVQRQPGRVFWNVAMSAAWAVFLCISGVGLVAIFRSPQRDAAVALVLLIVTHSAAAFSATAVRWSQRSPVEFALAILLAAGLAPVARRLRGGSSGRGSSTKR